MQYLTQNESVVSNSNINNSSSFSNPLPPPAKQTHEPSNLEFASAQVYEPERSNHERETKRNTFRVNNNNASFPNLNNNNNSQSSTQHEKLDTFNTTNENSTSNTFLTEESLVKQTIEAIGNDADSKNHESSVHLNELSLPVSVESTDCLTIGEKKEPTYIDNNVTGLPKSASFIETIPAKETDPCFNEPAVALTFSNNETINESINLNDTKEAREVDVRSAHEEEASSHLAIETKQESVQENLVEDTANKNISNETQISVNAQEIETSEF